MPAFAPRKCVHFTGFARRFAAAAVESAKLFASCSRDPERNRRTPPRPLRSHTHERHPCPAPSRRPDARPLDRRQTHARRVRPLRRRLHAGDRRARDAASRSRPAPRSRAPSRSAKAAFPGLGGDHTAVARPRHVPVQGAARAARRRDRRRHFARARQGALRRRRRAVARHRDRRIRVRRAAVPEERVQRERRHRHRRLHAAPAAGRRRRHHAVQLSGDGAAVDVPDGARLRQRVRAEAVGARSVGGADPGGAAQGGGPARRRVQRRQRRQGGGRRAARASGRAGGELRRLDADRALHLHDRHRARQARAGAGRRQEPRGGDARRGPRDGGGRAGRRRLRLGGRALHGHFGGGVRRRRDRRRRASAACRGRSPR